MNNRILISAPSRSSGKTTISLGIAKALSRTMKVQTFKKGPDYIDPLWLSFASNRPSYNLDYFIMGNDNIINSFLYASRNSDINIIEGNMGLYDSINLDGKGSSADLARTLKSPIILVINTKGINRSIAALLLGYLNFEKNTPIVGVILNKIKGKRHEDKLTRAIKQYSNIEILGCVPTNANIAIHERYLGLTPFVEEDKNYEILNTLEKHIKDNVNLERIIALAKTHSKPLVAKEIKTKTKITIKNKINIAIAKDKAFHFYYPDNLEALRKQGAELIAFDTLSDKQLPANTKALYLGGGFPELFMDKLSANKELIIEIKDAINRGMPVYAECGGLMYLAKSISFRNQTYAMTGVLPVRIKQTDKPQGFGYTILKSTNKGFFKPKDEIKAHEFHYSIAEIDDSKLSFAYEIKRGYGINKVYDGIIYKNVLASYSHIHALASPDWASSFVNFIRTIDFCL